MEPSIVSSRLIGSLLAALLVFSVGHIPAALAQSSECNSDFERLNGARLKQMSSLTALSKRKASLETAKSACSAFGRLVSADEALNSWVGENGDWCGIPENVKGQISSALTNSRKQRAQTCGSIQKAVAAQANAKRQGEACSGRFNSLSKARTNTIGSLNALSARQKKDPKPDGVFKACALLNTLVSRENELSGWMGKNAKSCNIPGKLITQIRGSLANSRKSRTETCALADRVKKGIATQAQAAAGAQQGQRPTEQLTLTPGRVPVLPGGGVKLPSGAL
jgi:hypothetical protein